MYRFTLLLIALSVTALCQAVPDDQRDRAHQYLNSMKDCILNNEGCPEDGSLAYSVLEPLIRTMVALRPPAECQCNAKTEACVRRCYYAYLVKSSMLSVAAGKTNATEIADAQNQTRDNLERHYKPCILENKDCAEGSIDYSNMADFVNQYKKNYELPTECHGDLSSENSVRICYFHYMRQTVLDSLDSKKKRRA